MAEFFALLFIIFKVIAYIIVTIVCIYNLFDVLDYPYDNQIEIVPAIMFCLLMGGFSIWRIINLLLPLI